MRKQQLFIKISPIIGIRLALVGHDLPKNDQESGSVHILLRPYRNFFFFFFMGIYDLILKKMPTPKMIAFMLLERKNGFSCHSELIDFGKNTNFSYQ